MPPHTLSGCKRRVSQIRIFIVEGEFTLTIQKKTNNNIVVTRLINNVPRIGLEPTCREALAPETSVSTISPSGLVSGNKGTKKNHSAMLFA